MKTFLHSGDRGDLIMSLPIVRDNGPGIFYVADKPWTRPITPWIESARKLLELQPYIHSLEVHGGQHVDHDFSTFRGIGHHRGRTITELHFIWVRLRCDQNQPWLSVPPSPDTAGKIVINRTARYNNPFFPWRSLVETFRDDMLFIGLPEEHQAFCAEFGNVEHLPTSDLYEVATAIEGCEVYIGNQSSPNAICEGLKHRNIQETHLQFADCIYPRSNAIHCFDGRLKFSACGKDFESQAVSYKQKLSTTETPQGGWSFDIGGITKKSYAFDALAVMAREAFSKLGQPVPADLKDFLLEQNRSKFPVTPEMACFTKLRDLIRRKYEHVGLAVPC